MPTGRLPLPIFCGVLLLIVPLIQAASPPPVTEKKPVTDVYHGVPVVDDYRWLEAADTPEVTAWTEAQNHATRVWLDTRPDRAALQAQLTTWYARDSPSYGWLTSRPRHLFSSKSQPPKQQRLLVMLASADDLASEKIIVDPNTLAPQGQVAMDWYVPSPDGSIVAVCLSENGSEEGTLHFYQSATGAALPDTIPRVQFPTAGGSAAWAPDGKSIFYTRFPRPGEKPEADLKFFQQVYVHVLGTSESADRYSIGQDFPRIAEIELSTSRDGRWLLAGVGNGDAGEFTHYVRDLAGGDRATPWRQVTQAADEIKQAALGCDDATLYLRSAHGSPRGKILRLPLDGTVAVADATVVVPESEAVIEDFVPTASYLYVAELIGGPSRLRRFDLAGQAVRVLPLPEYSGIANLLALQERPDDDRILFRQTSYTAPDAQYLSAPSADGADGAARKTALVKTAPVDFSDIEVTREYAISPDGTKVPLNILRRKGTKLDGTNPTLLTAYGGYGISLRPGFSLTRRLWFDRGGIVVIANIRGGGEYGEEWHVGGNLLRKQNCFDDFAACARHLTQRGYTSAARLAVEGGSNGGLLMGAFLTQHPDLARAVVSHVGIYDMLRVELDPNGAFNIPEFGTVTDPAQFRALYAYSPYQHVVDGTRYPAVFFLAGQTDGRVNPANSRKMTARLQAASSSGYPILLRLSADSGHGRGTALSERIAQEADGFAFLFDQLAVPGATK